MKQQLLHIQGLREPRVGKFRKQLLYFKNNNISMLLDSWYDTEERAHLFKHTYTYQK